MIAEHKKECNSARGLILIVILTTNLIGTELLPSSFAMGGVMYSQYSCQRIGGAWSASVSNTCLVTSLEIFRGETVTVSSGITLVNLGAILSNYGNLLNSNGVISNFGSISNQGSISNHGTIKMFTGIISGKPVVANSPKV